MADDVVITFTLEPDGRKAIRRMLHAMHAVARIVEDQPWNEDAKEALKHLRRVRWQFKQKGE